MQATSKRLTVRHTHKVSAFTSICRPDTYSCCEGHSKDQPFSSFQQLLLQSLLPLICEAYTARYACKDLGMKSREAL